MWFEIARDSMTLRGDQTEYLVKYAYLMVMKILIELLYSASSKDCAIANSLNMFRNKIYRYLIRQIYT